MIDFDLFGVIPHFQLNHYYSRKIYCISFPFLNFIEKIFNIFSFKIIKLIHYFYYLFISIFYNINKYMSIIFTKF